MKVIAFSGPQGTGKTTMMKKVGEYLESLDMSVYSGYRIPDGDSISRRTKSLGFLINEDTTFESQYHILLSYMLFDLETRKYAEQNAIEMLVYDRAIWDSLAYVRVSPNISQKQYYELLTIARYHDREYPTDVLFYNHPLDTIEDDGHRSVDVEFQIKVRKSFDKMLKEQAHRDLPKDSIENRMQMVLDALNGIVL